MWPDPDAYTTATWLFLRGLGATCVVAWVSLIVQLPGLYGQRGLSPVAEYLEELRELNASPARLAPSLFWIRATDGALWGVALAGLVASVAVVLDVLVVPALVVVWATYLSFVTVGREFLSFQWDVLLLEVVVLGAVLALSAPPSPVALLAAWVLVFRFIVSSGAAKLLSGDRTWRDLTALTYHHETQPLPTRWAWFLHLLPPGVHRAMTLGALVLEICVPFLLFVPGPVGLTAVALLAILQVVIAVSGNYGFFNLLSLVLLVPLVPDRVLAPLVDDPVPAGADPVAAATVAAGVLAAVLLALNVLRLLSLVRQPRWVRRVLAAVAPLRLANRYGLFAVMTTTRPEIVVEGSRDGTTWIPYRFRWKPVELNRPPRWNAPHQPRLDWQMWFAALGDLWSNPWVVDLARRLLEGSPPVLRLLADDPFDGEPPAHVRAELYEYRFTDRETRRRTGRWWERRHLGPYLPPVSRDSLTGGP